MTKEEDLFARVVAQQMQITALHTVLSKIPDLSEHDPALQEEIDTALNGSESMSREVFDAAVAEAVALRNAAQVAV